MIKRRFNQLSDAESGEASDQDQGGIPHPLVTVTKIDPDEIPDVPSNRFLYRGDRKKEEEDKSARKKDSNDEDERARERRRAQIRGRTKSGRKIKGRGLLVSKKCSYTFNF